MQEVLGKLCGVLNGTDYEALKDNKPLQQELARLKDQAAVAAGRLDEVTARSGNYA